MLVFNKTRRQLEMGSDPNFLPIVENPVSIDPDHPILVDFLAENINIQPHIASTANPHGVTKNQIGLASVDNTSDANKPVSDATVTALLGKAATDHGDHGMAAHKLASNDHPRDTRSQIAGTYATGTGSASGNNTGDQILPTTLPASDVSSWAKAATKPAYTYSEVGAASTSDGRLSDARTPIDATVNYTKIATTLKTKATVTSTVDLSANGIGDITLTGATAFTFSGFELNKFFRLIITANGFLPSFAVGAKHIIVGDSFATTGTFYVGLECIDATSGSEKLLTTIIKV